MAEATTETEIPNHNLMVQREIKRIQRLFEKSSGDKEDIITYAKEVSVLRGSAVTSND